MKRIFAALLPVMISTFLFAQSAHLTPSLSRQLSSEGAEDRFFQVNLVLKQQLDYSGLNHRFIFNNTPVNQRARKIISQAHTLADTSQESIIGMFRKNPKQVRRYKSFWIINMVSAEVRGDILLQLAENNKIDYIEEYDYQKGKLLEPVKTTPANNKAINGIEPGLAAINAPALWAMGYTGKGRKYFSIDTGVWPQHPAISDNFLANYQPMAQAWHGVDSDMPVDKSGSHGTHTTGTVLGLEAANNDTIGVAFNAYFMASDPIVVNLSNIKPLPEYIQVFEFALNPDGDTTTTDDIPDAINNSWGIATHDDTSICSGYVTQMFNAVEAAGIANVFSAGNEGPSDTTIGQPQYVSTGLVNTFTVGAVNGNNSNFPVTNFSSRGPTPCPASGSIAIKPEVVAPGYQVRSSVNSNSYSSYSGTSMAGPHATGAVLLLKEAFPYLSGQDILMALYNSAIDLGTAGEDNTYGMGMIDVMAAYNNLSMSNTPVPVGQRPYDIRVSEILSPGGNVKCDLTLNPEIVLENTGDSTISAAEIKYGIHDSTQMAFNWTGTLSPGNTDTVSLPLFQAPGYGMLEFLAKATIDSSKTECDYINNQRVKRFSIQTTTASLPFYENFESIGLDSSYWFVDNPDNFITWDTTATSGIQFSNYSAYINLFPYNPKDFQKDGLVTPNITIPNEDSVMLKFEVAYQEIHSLLADTLRVYVSTDCGQNYTEVYKKGGTDLETYNVTTGNWIPSSSDHWRTEYVDITSTASGNDILVRFESENLSGNNLFLDNIWIYEGAEPAGEEENKVRSSMRLYPNPAGDYVTLELEGRYADGMLEVRDLIGRKVMEKKVKGKINKMDTRSFREGLYLFKYTDAQKGNSEVKKVVIRHH